MGEYFNKFESSELVQSGGNPVGATKESKNVTLLSGGGAGLMVLY